MVAHPKFDEAGPPAASTAGGPARETEGDDRVDARADAEAGGRGSRVADSGMHVHLFREVTDDNTWYAARLVESGGRLPLCSEVQGYSGQGPEAALENLTRLLERLGLPTEFEVTGRFAEVRLRDEAEAPELEASGVAGGQA